MTTFLRIKKKMEKIKDMIPLSLSLSLICRRPTHLKTENTRQNPIKMASIFCILSRFKSYQRKMFFSLSKTDVKELSNVIEVSWGIFQWIKLDHNTNLNLVFKIKATKKNAAKKKKWKLIIKKMCCPAHLKSATRWKSY